MCRSLIASSRPAISGPAVTPSQGRLLAATARRAAPASPNTASRAIGARQPPVGEQQQRRHRAADRRGRLLVPALPGDPLSVNRISHSPSASVACRCSDAPVGSDARCCVRPPRGRQVEQELVDPVGRDHRVDRRVGDAEREFRVRPVHGRLVQHPPRPPARRLRRAPRPDRGDRPGRAQRGAAAAPRRRRATAASRPPTPTASPASGNAARSALRPGSRRSRWPTGEWSRCAWPAPRPSSPGSSAPTADSRAPARPQPSARSPPRPARRTSRDQARRPQAQATPAGDGSLSRRGG